MKYKQKPIIKKIIKFGERSVVKDNEIMIKRKIYKYIVDEIRESIE